FTLEVSLLAGSNLPTLMVGTYSRYQSRWDPQAYPLKSGINTISDGVGGILYLRFSSDNAKGKVRIRLISGMKPMPYYQLGKTTQADWEKMVDNIKDVPDVQLVGKKTILCFSLANAALNKKENQEALLNLADRVVVIEDSISGLFGTDPKDQPNVHKILMTESDHPGYYMAATWYRTWYRVGDGVPAITAAHRLTWGPWHELGHMHQQSHWTWDELGEVTVNVYSLAVEKALGITPTRLTQQNEWNNAVTFLALPDGQRNFNNAGTSVWVRLCMFQQLKLAFGDEFYYELHKLARRSTENVNDTNAKMRWFMLNACRASKHNLSDFFKKWGLQLSNAAATNAVYSDIEGLNLPAPATDLTMLKD
ncbi:MAG TPA: M60 family metallopeptidase, partial [Phnomibacter sp.]|nr:M60 family metallopeptidase [Phnomibacter sp.]